ncbi:MAG: isoprenylcysteine carboxylmethyltransferase family protein [Vicinamibacterales bacterium]
MDLDATFRPVVVVAFFTIIGIALPFRIRSQSTGESLDRTQEGLVTMITLRVAGLAMWVGVIAFMISPASMAWASLPLNAAARWSGVALGAVTALLLVWTLRSLGPNLTDTVVTRQAHTLVTRGPYRLVRHPFYDCMALFMTATALMMANWFVFAAGVVTFAILASRSRTEEQKLLERFGEPYRAYRATTGRFVPGVGRVA